MHTELSGIGDYKGSRFSHDNRQNMTSESGKQPQKKMAFMCLLWFSLFFLVCFSSKSVQCIPLDMMRGENHPHRLFKFNSGSLQSFVSQPNQKMAHFSFNPSNSFTGHNDFERERRNSGQSLSIVNPLDVLRQRLLIDIERRHLHSQNSQINANTEFLKTIGKRQ